MNYIVMVLVVFAVMALTVLGLATGVLAGRKPIAGSCGGIASLGIEKQCSICGGVPEKCEDANRDESTAASTDLAYDATKA